MVDASLSISAAAPSPSPTTKPVAEQPSFFHQLLSELNPLQYVPVVGTIYRAVTGDTIPETARFAGSLVVSGLTGGPVGIALNLGLTMIERFLGIDPEEIGGKLLAELGIGGSGAPTSNGSAPADAPVATAQDATAAPAAAPTAGQTKVAAADAPAAANTWWSPAQLKAYGISRDADGGLTLGTMSGADVLNTLELARISNSPMGTTAAAA